MDIRPLIKSSSVCYEDGKILIKCVLSADPSAFLNPEYIVKILRDKCGILSGHDLIAERYSINRISAYREDMSEFR